MGIGVGLCVCAAGGREGCGWRGPEEGEGLGGGGAEEEGERESDGASLAVGGAGDDHRSLISLLLPRHVHWIVDFPIFRSIVCHHSRLC